MDVYGGHTNASKRTYLGYGSQQGLLNQLDTTWRRGPIYTRLKSEAKAAWPANTDRRRGRRPQTIPVSKSLCERPVPLGGSGSAAGTRRHASAAYQQPNTNFVLAHTRAR